MDFVVTLSSPAYVTVNYATADGTATAGDDYVATSGMLTFDGGETRKTVSVPIIDDRDEDDGETFTLTLSNVQGASIQDAEATGTIRNTEPPPPEALTAAFDSVPASHNGNAFRFRVEFSEDVGTSYKTLRDESFSVTAGEVTGARRVDGRNDLWEITVEPDSRAAVGIELPGGRACGTTGAVCTGGSDPRPLSNSPSATVAGPAPTGPALTAAFDSVPSTHAGGAFTFKLTFSEDVGGLSYKTLRDHAFRVTGGSVQNASRRTQGSNRSWNIKVAPRSASDAVAITLPETTDCGATGAICTEDDRPLSHSLADTVDAASSSASDAGGGEVQDDGPLAIADGVTPDEAAAALFGERELGEARLTALDRLGNRNGRYDLGDLLSWIERCRRGEARCGSTSTDSGPAAGAALLARGRGRTWGRLQAAGTARFPAPQPSAERRRAPQDARGRLRPGRAAGVRGVLVVHRRVGADRAGVRRARSRLADRRMDGAAGQPHRRRPAGTRGSGHRSRPGRGARVVPGPNARTAPDGRGGRPRDGSARALSGTGPRPAGTVPGPRDRGHGRGLRAQGRGQVRGGDPAALTAPG